MTREQFLGGQGEEERGARLDLEYSRLQEVFPEISQGDCAGATGWITERRTGAFSSYLLTYTGHTSRHSR